MKYIFLLYGSQQAFDAMAGKATDTAPLSPEDFAPTYAFMLERLRRERGSVTAAWPRGSITARGTT